MDTRTASILGTVHTLMATDSDISGNKPPARWRGMRQLACIFTGPFTSGAASIEHMLKQRDSDYSSNYQLMQQTVNGERIQ
jgi:hypothetical protein